MDAEATIDQNYKEGDHRMGGAVEALIFSIFHII